MGLSPDRQPLLLLALADRTDAAVLPAVVKAATSDKKALRLRGGRRARPHRRCGLDPGAAGRGGRERRGTGADRQEDADEARRQGRGTRICLPACLTRPA